MITRVFGWRVNINQNLLRVFEARFQYKYDYHVFVDYIKRGDYISAIPFGLFQEGEKFYVIAEKKPDFLCIIDNPAQYLKEVNYKVEIKNGLETYIHTFLNDILVSNGYSRPIENKSLVGKSKGVVSLKNKPVKLIKHDFFGRKTHYLISKAERFETHLNDQGEIIVFYDPRHEISESFFNLVSKSLIPEQVIEMTKQLVRTYNNIKQRYYDVNKILKEYKTNIINISDLEVLNAIQLEFPQISINGDQIKENLSVSTYHTIVKSKIQLDSFCEKISVFIDNTGEKISDAIINPFLEKFETLTGINTEKILFEDPENIENIENFDVSIIILNDIMKGSEWVYKTFKQRVNQISKVIKLSTISEKPWEEIIKLTWMALRFRSTNKLLMLVHKQEFKNIIALNIIPVLRGSWLVLSGVKLKDDKIKSKIIPFYNKIGEEVFKDEVIEEFIENLIAEDINQETLLLFGSLGLKRALTKIAEKQKCSLVLIRVSNSSMFGIEEDEEPMPMDGSYTRISNHKYLLMTNGFPNKPDGIPKPIIVKILRSELEDTKIIQELFNQTFIHPMSFTKTKFPFPFTLVKSNVSEILLPYWQEFNKMEDNKNET